MPISDFKDDPYLSVLRPLVEAYLAFYRVASRHIESMGVTPGQFDVIAELQGTKGLTCAELTRRALTTKGTLTGVLDRLEQKGLIQRDSVGGDRRATRVRLTSKGSHLVKQVFPAHAEFMRPFFSRALKLSEVTIAKRLLGQVRDSFDDSMNSSAAKHVVKVKVTKKTSSTRKKGTRKG